MNYIKTCLRMFFTFGTFGMFSGMYNGGKRDHGYIMIYVILQDDVSV